jgi:hypothetical protein
MGRLASAFAHLRWTILVVVVAACQQGWLPHLPDAGVLEPFEIRTSSDTAAIPPGGTHRLGFQLLTAEETPVPDAVINFTILDKDTPGSGGAQLSMSSGLTDEQGWVVLQVFAGAGSTGQKPLSFYLYAAAGDVTAKLPIFITQGTMASAQIVPETEKAWDGEDAVASTSLFFYDDAVCADVSGEQPPPCIRGGRKLTPEVRSMDFSNIVTSGVHAVLAVATGTRGKVVAKGCAELPGNSLSPDQIMRLTLPLARIHISPLGTYRVQSHFPLPSEHATIVSIRKQWQGLSTKACDPASLWLDCTIDALNGDSPADPLDCQPMAGEEGELGALLTARRAVSGGKLCTGQLDAKGKLSLDARTYMLFPSGFLSNLSLGKLPDDVSATLTKLSVESTLTVKESDSINVLDMEHALNTVALSVYGVPVTAAVVDLGLPVRDVWFASTQSPTQSPGQLILGTHGFTLRLGSFARAVFVKTSQAFSRSGSADVGAFVSYLFNGAVRNTRDNPQQGCDALDSLLCEEAGQDPGCIAAACQAGLRALINRLDSSFSFLDGPGLDFSLSGYALLSDPDGDGQANGVNSGFLNAVFPGQMFSTDSWSAQLIAPPSR